MRKKSATLTLTSLFWPSCGLPSLSTGSRMTQYWRLFNVVMSTTPTTCSKVNILLAEINHLSVRVWISNTTVRYYRNLGTVLVWVSMSQGSQHSWSLTQFLYGIKHLQSGTKVVDTLVRAFLNNFIHLLLILILLKHCNSPTPKSMLLVVKQKMWGS